MGGIIFIIIVIAVLSVLPAGKASAHRRRYRRQSNKPHGLPWMGGSIKKKKKDYFSD